jgi:hypothetical protein
MVRQAASSFNTHGGTGGKGSANSVDVADGEVEIECLDQRNPRAHLGRSQHRFATLFGGFGLSGTAAVPRRVSSRARQTDVSVFAGVTGAPTSVEAFADRLLPSERGANPLAIPGSEAALRDKMSGGEVGEFPERSKRQFVIPCDSHTDGFVEIEDFMVVAGVLHGCELPDDELLVLGELIGPVGVDVHNGTFGNSEGDRPFAVSLDCSGGFTGSAAG